MDNIIRCPKCSNKYMIQHKVGVYAEQHVHLPGHEYTSAASTPQEHCARFCILECVVCGHMFDSSNVAYSLDYQWQMEHTKLVQDIAKIKEQESLAKANINYRINNIDKAVKDLQDFLDCVQLSTPLTVGEGGVPEEEEATLKVKKNVRNKNKDNEAQ